MKKIIEKILTLIRKNEILKQSKAKQSKAKQSKAKQSKANYCLALERKEVLLTLSNLLLFIFSREEVFVRGGLIG